MIELIHPTFLPARADSTTTWHTILSFSPASNNYLRGLRKGSQVYVEANFELREPEPSADPDTPQGQRQIFLRHGKYCYFLYSCMLIRATETIRLLKSAPAASVTEEDEE